MRCKKHFTDYSSGVGVCASCLRERLLNVIETQFNDDKSEVLLVKPQFEDDANRKSDAIPPQIVFPRSVSPYVTRRKSDMPHLQHSLSEQRFYSTPQIGPNGVILESSLYKRRNGKFSMFSNLFRSKTQKFDSDPNFDAKPRKSNSSASTTETETATATSSWFSSLFAKKNKSRMMSKSFPAFGDRNNRRGMSPTLECDEEFNVGSSGYSSESSPGWKETPVRATPQARRRQNQQRNVAGLVFCLSPLVRPSPNRRGMPPETAIPSGEMRVPAKPHLGDAASFRANRSRKLANFGRFHPKY